MGAHLEPLDFYPHLDRFSIFYCAVFIGIVLFPLLITKQVTFLIKLNSYGIYFVLVSIIFVISNGIYSICTSTFDFDYKVNYDTPKSPRHLYLFGDNPILLAGTLTLSYFSHSFVLPMMKNNERQENNKRDLFLGYCLVFFTYVFLGILGYIGFSGENYEAEFKDVKYYLYLHLELV
jgi:sodium-coupled neutral amino acid transporter 9